MLPLVSDLKKFRNSGPENSFTFLRPSSIPEASVTVTTPKGGAVWVLLPSQGNREERQVYFSVHSTFLKKQR